MDDNLIENLRIIDRIQDSNINFIFGSGMSAGYLGILGNIEQLLTDLDKNEYIEKEKKNFIRASILKKYFDEAIVKNLNVLSEDDDTKDTLNSYKEFFSTVNELIALRKNGLLTKQVNIFTTNIDVFLEKGIEETRLESNDGFSRGFKPKYDLSNFKKSIFQKSPHFDNSTEIPIFNILKIHGSLTWSKQNDENIFFDNTLSQVAKVREIIAPKLLDVSVNGDKKDNLESLLIKCPTSILEDDYNNFLEEYDKLLVVNPTKAKFQETVLNQKYYDLLRIYANELEKENTLLFVMGFSFADEHIRDLTIRVANSNPTLMIYIFAYTTDAKTDLESVLNIENNLKNHNIRIISPTQTKTDNEPKDDFVYDFDNINNKFFRKIKNKIEGLADE
ncbi:SIR2 family protein [Francisellaceae bacterium CB52]|jgi:hypothetical protein